MGVRLNLLVPKRASFECPFGRSNIYFIFQGPSIQYKTKWEEADEYTDNPGQRVLTPEAMAELRATIRKERRERREKIEFYIKLMGGIIAIATGLVGALIGLVSTWNHK